MMLNQVKQDLRQHKFSSGGLRPAGSTHSAYIMEHEVPVEDAVNQLKIELQLVQLRLRSDATSIGVHVFESYKDTLKWMVSNWIPEDWQYAMNFPALYSLVMPYGQGYQVLLEEEYNSSKSRDASSTQARLASSSKTKVPGIFGADKLSKNGHPFIVW
jgi:hypothetical protein